MSEELTPTPKKTKKLISLDEVMDMARERYLTGVLSELNKEVSDSGDQLNQEQMTLRKLLEATLSLSDRVHHLEDRIRVLEGR